MIITKELQYVNSWANRIPMPGIDYQNMKNDFFYDYRQTVLGITLQDYTSFDLLESILENAEKVAENDNGINNNKKVINYYKSQIKCNIFKKISDFEKFDFAVINYDAKDGKYDYKNQKLLFVPSNESVCSYFIMGIKVEDNVEQNDYIQKYIVNTLMAPLTPKTYFDKEVIIPTQILVSDNYGFRRINATAEEKIKLLTMYKSIINQYQIPNKLDISGDYELMLNDIAQMEYKKEKSL